MKNFGTALKRALDANGRLPSELANTAGVTGNAVAWWLKSISFQRVKKPLANSAGCEGIFCLLPFGYRRARRWVGPLDHSERVLGMVRACP